MTTRAPCGSASWRIGHGRVGPWRIVARLLLPLVLLVGLAGAAAAGNAGQTPANDDFADAIDLVPSTELTKASLTAATGETGEPVAFAGSPVESVWFRYRATTGGVAVALVVTSGDLTAFPVDVVLHRGTTLGGLVRRDALRATVAAGFLGGAIVFRPSAGETYHVQLTSPGGTTARKYVLLGLQALPTAGGIALFTAAPAIVDESLGSSASVYVVNALGTAATLEAALPGLAPFFTTEGGGAVADEAVRRIRAVDAPAANLRKLGTTVGSLVVTARAASGGAVLASASTPVFAVNWDASGGPVPAPPLTVRFQHQTLGSRNPEPVWSTVAIRNDSATATALGCRFEAENGQSTVAFDLRRSADVFVARNAPFNVAPGEIRTVRVFLSPGINEAVDEFYNDRAVLRCLQGRVSQGDLRGMLNAFNRDGPDTRVTLSLVGADVLRRVAVPPGETTRLVVVVHNHGEYGGRIEITTFAWPMAATLQSMCRSTMAGVCTSTPVPRALHLTLRPGQSVPVTLVVATTATLDPRFSSVDLNALAPHYPGGARSGGHASFQLVPR